MNEKMRASSRVTKEKPYKLSVGVYESGGGLAITILKDTGDGYEPYDELTVNLPIRCDLNAAYINTNHHPGAEEELIKHQMGRPTGRVADSGFCEYPEFLFDVGKLVKQDRKGYIEYLGQFDIREGLVRVSAECSSCGYQKYFDITEEQAKQYEDYCYRRPGFLLIQDIFPDMEKGDRELLRGNSFCKLCWDKMFGKCPEDREDMEGEDTEE